MEKNQKELESLVNSQKEQLNRYEARLKDVVTAYKGLLKEKEALETSLSALSESKECLPKIEQPNDENKSVLDLSNSGNKINSNDLQLQTQISTLMNSLATLSAEKSRMEQSFQADKKKLRSDLSKKDVNIYELEDRIKELEKQNGTELENMKSKVIIEKHEREKETNNHMVMIRELQKLISDERHLKENLEMQLNDLKQKISSTSNSSLSKNSIVKDLTAEIKGLKEKIHNFESIESNDTAAILQQLQTEMLNLKKQHAIAIRTEQKRAHFAEDRNRKLAEIHEDRVQNLEARLAELSTTVGKYDQLRHQDQESIQNLKDKLHKLSSSSSTISSEEIVRTVEPENNSGNNLHSLYEEIIQLKKKLWNENAISANPIDISKIYGQNIGDHSQCQEDMVKLHEELEHSKLNCQKLQNIIDDQKRSIKILQVKIQILNDNIDDQELDIKKHSEKLNQSIKTEKAKYNAELNSLENEYRCKINELEQQLHKQRSRSLQLLEDKENEIKALKTSFEIFSPLEIKNNENNGRKTSISSHMQSILSPSIDNSVGSENCHIIHYANEIARKDVEVTTLRKAKYSAEYALRQALQDKVNTQEELHDKIDNLQEEVARLERCKTREGANLEYLKNVFISFLSTSSLDGKRHMVNAIAAVLQFSPAEMKAINTIIFNKK